MMPAPLPIDIRRARILAGLTQAQAAKLVNRTMRAWHSWEAGLRRMDPILFEVFETKVARLELRRQRAADRARIFSQ